MRITVHHTAERVQCLRLQREHWRFNLVNY